MRTGAASEGSPSATARMRLRRRIRDAADAYREDLAADLVIAKVLSAEGSPEEAGAFLDRRLRELHEVVEAAVADAAVEREAEQIVAATLAGEPQAVPGAVSRAANVLQALAAGCAALALLATAAVLLLLPPDVDHARVAGVDLADAAVAMAERSPQIPDRLSSEARVPRTLLRGPDGVVTSLSYTSHAAPTRSAPTALRSELLDLRTAEPVSTVARLADDAIGEVPLERALEDVPVGDDDGIDLPDVLPGDGPDDGEGTSSEADTDPPDDGDDQLEDADASALPTPPLELR